MQQVISRWMRWFLSLALGVVAASAPAWGQVPAAPAAAAPPAASSPAAPEADTPLVLTSTYWHDASGHASLAQAQQQPGTRFESLLNRGYAVGAHWVRLRIAATDRPVALRLTPAWLDEISLHDPLQPRPVTVGDRHPGAGNALAGLGFSLALPAADQPRDVWLRLSSTSAHRMGIDAMPLDELPRAQAHTLIGTALYGAVLLLMLVVLLAAWAIQPDRALGFFLLRHGVFSLFAISYLGLPTLMFADMFPPVFFDRLFSVVTILSVPAGLAFDIALLSAYGPPRWLIAALRVALGVCLGVFSLFLLGHERLALEANVQVITVASLLIYAAAWMARPKPSVELLMPKKALLGYYTLILGSLVMGMLSVQGWTKPGNVTVPVVIVHGLVSGLVMTGILFMRALRQQAANRQTRWQLQQAQQDVVQEQRRREEQSQFLHMLMHELKTPLSIVTLALGTRENKAQNLQAASQAVQQMKAVIERCVQADQVGEQPLSLHAEVVDLHELVQQVAAQTSGLQGRVRWPLHVSGHALPASRAQPASGEVQSAEVSTVSGTHAATQVCTDRQWAQTIVANLLENAGRYGDPHSPIEVEVQARHEDIRPGVALRVRNTPGLAGWPDEAQLFTKYYRAAGAQRESGSGLGLYLSRQLARSLRGHLRYLPTSHHIQFELWLPSTLS